MSQAQTCDSAEMTDIVVCTCVSDKAYYAKSQTQTGKKIDKCMWFLCADTGRKQTAS
jgi:hypothetical protein